MPKKGPIELEQLTNSLPGSYIPTPVPWGARQEGFLDRWAGLGMMEDGTGLEEAQLCVRDQILGPANKLSQEQRLLTQK